MASKTGNNYISGTLTASKFQRQIRNFNIRVTDIETVRGYPFRSLISELAADLHELMALEPTIRCSM